MKQSGSNAKQLTVALQLIQKAFAQAGSKRWQPAQSITLAVLNNRLLRLTDRQFKPSDYGAKDLRALLEMLAPEVVVKRLAEKGFINEGAKSLTLAHLEQMVRARRLEIGEKTWKIERGRVDNLCLTYVDSELKSGATTTRELRNILRPGKSGGTNEIGTWMRTHVDDDPMVVLVDDFAGTGSTLVNGINRFRSQVDAKIWQRYLSEGRISVFIMFAFPEAVENVRRRCAGVHAVAATVLGDDLRACSPEAAIFENEADLRFARDVLLQLGRELYPSAPLGFGDTGVLVAFHNACPNNTLPIFWNSGVVGERGWKPIFPRA
jgi:hypothetical protein